MIFSGVNYLAVVIAALAGFGVGAVWYMALGKAWLNAIGKTEAQIKQDQGAAKALPFVIALIANFVMALMLAGLLGHLGDVTVKGGVISAFFVWLGFVITTMGVNHAFGGADPKLTMIDGGHWLAVLIVMGAVLGAMGA